MNPAAMGALAASIAVPLVFRALRRTRKRAPSEPVGRSMEELKRDYGRWDLRGRLCFLVLAGLTFWLPWSAFMFLGSLVVPNVPDAVYLLAPGGLAWALPSLFMSIVLGGMGTDVVLRRYLRDAAYAEFVQYQRRLNGFDVDRVARVLYVVVPVFSLVAAGLIANCYAYVTPRALVFNPLLGFQDESIAMDQIGDILTAPKVRAPLGNEVVRREYVVRGRDGRTWSTETEPSNASPERKREIAEYLSRQSGVPIREIPILTGSESR